MVKLMAETPLGGLEAKIGASHLREVDPGPITSLAPLAGQRDALDRALLEAHGLGWPAPGDSLSKGAGRILWSGPDQALLMGVAAEPGLAACAALTDQSDAWAALELSGAAARAVLARLTAVDLRDSAFPVGATARCQLVHMNMSLTRIDTGQWLILVFRSMAGSAVAEIRHAMAGVAARD